jgi:hypothetical protein
VFLWEPNQNITKRLVAFVNEATVEVVVTPKSGCQVNVVRGQAGRVAGGLDFTRRCVHAHPNANYALRHAFNRNWSGVLPNGKFDVFHWHSPVQNSSVVVAKY